jgi:hypothetical protein
MINMNIFFEFMLMILKNRVFKIYLSRFLKNASRFFLIFWVTQRDKVSFK